MIYEASWRRGGLIYCLDERIRWASSHVQIPTLCAADESSLRILFASRDSKGRSLTGALDVSASNPQSILQIDAEPVLELGSPGCFDDQGVMPSSVVEVDGVYFLYYIGWNSRSPIPYHNSVGLAVSTDEGKTFRKLFPGPVMDRTPEEPYFCGTTCVRVENGIWRNWYLSCTGWSLVSGRMEPRYHLKYAESKDGITWLRHGTVAVDFSSDEEGGIARASVVREGGLYKMWYSYRGLNGYRTLSENSYKIGYAESGDGIVWERIDRGPILDCADSGWDAEMVAYPEIVDTTSGRYMFYNGNGFGKSGFGYALSDVLA